MIRNRPIFYAVLLLTVCWWGGGSSSLFAQNIHQSEYESRYFLSYEVGNSIELSDFGMGSNESIRDRSGYGVGMATNVKKGRILFMELVLGFSHVQYKGSVEEAVAVDFQPQSDTSISVFDESANVTYEIDVEISKPYLGVNFRLGLLSFGGGVIRQNVTGDGVRLQSLDNTELVHVEYLSQTTSYANLGLFLDLEEFYFAANGHIETAPEMQFNSCNEEALGDLVCARIKASISNRNATSRTYGSLMLQFGFLF